MKSLHAFTRSLIIASAALVSVSASAVDFPLRADDINLNYRYTTTNHWSKGAQTDGFDILAQRHIGNGKWSEFKTDNADTTLNSSRIIYGAKIRAMEAGTVVNCWRNSPENTPGSNHPKVGEGYIAYAGNYLYVRHDDGNYALYAHAQPGSIPTSLCPHNAVYNSTGKAGYVLNSEGWVSGGARITKGQVLGLVGNVGNSDRPHLHVHMQTSADQPVEIKFDHGQTTPFTNQTASVNATWTLLQGKKLPDGEVMIWAPHSVAYWTVNNIPDERMQAWFNHFADSGVMPNVYACTDNGQIYNTGWVPSSGSWQAFHGMTLTAFTKKSNDLAQLGYTRYGWWYCGSVYTGIWRK
ncbi:M23 family metallopeptidase [Cellvibrio mixtus]|uniref:M23 family metallopeptidase n=1 Tax=Cellvibrio mixtus TaxID=39650 RepID=UPI0005876F39|nr:M23 family metallopeptidase [Cellvibrio mixtus]